MPDTPQSLMLFAAGFGTRMGALTAQRPKPLVEVAGRALIDHALALVQQAGVSRVVVNLHYRGAQIAAHLAERHMTGNLALSWERDAILETGGGLRAALPLLGPGPVFTLNPDAIWTGANPLAELRAGWAAAAPETEALLLLAPCAGGTGDFRVGPSGRISRGGGDEDHRYLGAQILRTGRLDQVAQPAFSLNRIWDLMIADGTARGLVHDGGWCDVGRPEGIAEAERLLSGAHDD
jgi:MurNAc alpha-1-phosphate uridylyltransferase